MSCFSRFRIRYEDQNALIVNEYSKSSKYLQNHIIPYQIDPKPTDNISPLTLNSSQTFLSPSYIKTMCTIPVQYSTLDILPILMPLRIPSFPELFHCGIVFRLRWPPPRPLRSLKDSFRLLVQRYVFYHASDLLIVNSFNGTS